MEKTGVEEERENGRSSKEDLFQLGTSGSL